MATIYLAHPVLGAGLQRPWNVYAENLARVRLLAEGLRTTQPGLRLCYLAGCLPGPDGSLRPTPEQCALIQPRLLLGDAPPGPDRLAGHRHSPCATVWVCGPYDEQAAQAVALAEAQGLPHEVLSESEQGHLLTQASRAIADRLATVAVNVRLGEHERELRSPLDVLEAWTRGADQALGARALDYGRVGAGAYHSAVAHLERMSARIAAAAGIVHRAMSDPRWSERTLLCLEMIQRGHSFRQVSALLGGLNVQITWRIYWRGIDCLRDALLERAQQQDQTEAQT